ncbi:hypothetical protein pipiens_015272 [Culex pipiens pipiens]|uniref:Venom allergen-1 n=1 Tax=Culex pipiens pipiens TaxID=38569 RepID=A0ABD1CR81_CULPP
MKLFSTVLLLLTVGTFGHAQQTDYCDPDLCAGENGPHIMCDGQDTTSMSDDCGSGAVERPLGAEHRALIVDMHNRIRSKVAMGQQNYTRSKYLPQAVRMATMRWDAELAAMAAANARRCQNEHDACHNTKKYPTSGQNLATQSFEGKKIPDDTVLIKGFINDWFSEHRYADPALVARYPENYDGPDVGHFTQLVRDRCTAVGCAMVRFKDASKWTTQYMVCNYAITQLENKPVYVAGAACSKCTTGCNSKYPGLCSVEEKILPKP